MLIEGLLTSVAVGCMCCIGGIIIKSKDEEETEAEEIIETNNIIKYEYIPIENVICESKISNIITYTFEEGNKDGVKAHVGYDLDGGLKIIDLLEGHIITGGASRWGKSSFLNIFILYEGI